MDLYRILRLSFYAMVTSAALALYVAERNLCYPLAVVAAAAAAHLTVDRGRLPPVRHLFVYALALALLVYHFMPLRNEEAWQQQGLVTVAHFLCLLQTLCFFLAYRGVVLLLAGAASLVLVILSGILDPGPTVLPRMAAFVALSAWTMLVHSLWRAREDFSAYRRLAGRRSVGATPAGAPPGLLSGRALGQGLALAATLSASGLALGLLLFFSAPRVNETLTGWVEYLLRNREARQPSPNGSGLGRGSGGAPAESGFDDTLDLNRLGPVLSNHSPALAVTFSPLPAELAGGTGRILLRGLALSVYEDGKWQLPALQPGGNLRPPVDPSAPGVRLRGAEFQQTVAPGETLHSRFCFASGPVARLSLPQAVVDSEGTWRSADGQPLAEPYDLWSRLPVRAEDLPADAKAVHPDRKYLAHGLGPHVHQEVLACARQVTRPDPAQARVDLTALHKARRIVSHLRDSGRYTYSARLDELQRSGEPLAEFLLSADPLKRRGHCGRFASAFVVLCRLSAIPARLAKGFAASPPAAAVQEGAQRVVFRHSDAHAWGEVFFENFGWVSFDPTPSAPSPPSAISAPPASAQPGAPAAAAQSLVSQAWAAVMGYSSQEQGVLYRRVGERLRHGLGGAGAVLSGDSGGGWAGAVLAWVITVLLLWRLMQAFLRHGRRRPGRPGAAAVRARAALAFYNDLLQVLSRRGFVRKPGQTPREFADHVLRRGGPSFKAVLVVTDVFEGVRYGGREITQEEFNRLQEALDNLRELTFVAQ